MGIQENYLRLGGQQNINDNPQFKCWQSEKQKC